MPRGKKAHDTSDVSDPSEQEMDSDDSGKDIRRPPKKKMMKKEQPKAKAAPRKPSPRKRKAVDAGEAEEAGGSKPDSDEDNAQNELVQEYDEENLLALKVPEKPIPCMEADGGSRLIITDIVVENFKSYYGTRRIGPFHHSFTSIIGPNGSGKSNVIDALLFVFGYKASKIRSKKVSVLIHSSAGKDDIQSCTVKISFQKIIDKPDGTYDVVPKSSFNVSRTAHKNNTSDYRMNGERTSFKEVAEKLRKMGIDLVHNRFLILQGEVEQIAMMKPKAVNGGEDGMLEYLEDIIGSSRFKIPIEKVAAKLEKLQTEKSHQNAKVNMALREKEALDEPVQNQLAYMRMENESVVLRCKQTLYKKYKAENSLEELVPKKATIQEDLEKVKVGLAELGEKLKEKRSVVEKIARENGKLQNDIDRITNEIEVIMQRDVKRIHDTERCQKELKKLATDVKKEQAKLAEARQAPIDAKAKIEQLKLQLEEHKEELSTAQEMFDENFPKYNKKTEADRAKKAELEEEYSNIATKLAEAEGQCKLAESSLHSMVEDYEKKKKQLEALEASIVEEKKKREHCEREREIQRGRFEESQEITKTARAEMEKIMDRQDTVKTRLKELDTLFQDNKQQEAQSIQFMNKISIALEKAMNQSNLGGYHGRLGDLGSIDAKYDRAISNNFGALDLHVVDDNLGAFQGSAILKKLNLRTSFILLNIQQALWSQVKKCQAEKNAPAPRLFNMINCEERYRPAFFNAVRWTYVVEDMAAAHQLYKKLVAERRPEQIVTMDGCMLSKKGAFIGGGTVKEGKMGGAKVNRRASSIAADERNARAIEAAQNEKRELDEELQNLSKQYHEEEKRLNEAAAPLDKAAKAQAKVENEIRKLKDVIKTREEQRGPMAAEVERSRVDEKEVEGKKREIEQLKRVRDEAAETAQSSKARIKEIDVDMAKVYNKLVKPHEESRDIAKEAIETVEKELSKQTAIVNGGERNLAKQQSRLEGIMEDLDAKRVKHGQVVDLADTILKRQTELEKQREDCRSTKAENDEKLKEIRAGMSEMDSEEVAIQKREKLLTEELAETKGLIKALKRTVEEHTGKAAEFKLHNVKELMFEIPDAMQQSTSNRRFLLDGESESDIDDYEEFMTGSPSKKKALKEAKKSRKEEVKKRKRTVEDEEEEEEEGEREGEEEEGGERMEIEGENNSASAENQEGDEEERREREKEAKRAKRKEKKMEEEAMIERGEMPAWAKEHIMKLDKEGTKITLDDLDRKISSMKKSLVAHVLVDYKAKVDKLRRESSNLTEITQKYTDHRVKLEEMKRERLADFMGGFESISTALREMYQMITLGGDASLELKDLIDPFLEGVQFMVRPPKKSWKQIENLSGGEKTLSSLALVFALHKYRPTPLYVMDEIDAALDFRNVSIIGHYIKDRTKNAQFIIISLRNNMFELADRLIGIYKVHDCTRNVVVDPKKVLEETKEMRSGLDKVRRLMESNKIQTGVGFGV